VDVVNFIKISNNSITKKIGENDKPPSEFSNNCACNGYRKPRSKFTKLFINSLIREIEHGS